MSKKSKKHHLPSTSQSLHDSPPPITVQDAVAQANAFPSDTHSEPPVVIGEKRRHESGDEDGERKRKKKRKDRHKEGQPVQLEPIDPTMPAEQMDAGEKKKKKKKKKHRHHDEEAPVADAITPQEPHHAPLPDYSAHNVPIDPSLTSAAPSTFTQTPTTLVESIISSASALLQQQQHSQNAGHPQMHSQVPPPTTGLGLPGGMPGDDPLFPLPQLNVQGAIDMLQSSEDILRVIQDLHKFAGSLRFPGSDPALGSVSAPPPVAGPSNSGTSTRPKKSAPPTRLRKVVVPPPNPNTSASYAINAAHAEMLATKWMSPSKLKEMVEKEGLVYKKGKFSAIEEEQLKTAIDQYAKERRLSQTDINAIIFAQGKAKDANASFWSEITRALPLRPIIAVYHHVRRIYHPMKAQGKWTPEEDALLRSAVTEVGQRWELVSSRVGRMSGDCRDRYRNHIENRERRVSGAWTVEEEEELIRIMQTEVADKGKDTDSDVFWGIISAKMGNRRSRQQVRIKWTDGLSTKLKNAGQQPRWSSQDAYILVHKVASLNVNDDTEIDWKLLIDPDWNIWSAHQLQRRWLTLKRSIKNHEELSFPEILEILKAKKADAPNFNPLQKGRGSKRTKIMNEVIAEEHLEGEDLDDTGLPPGMSMDAMGLGDPSLHGLDLGMVTAGGL